ncbi:MAG: hypothetical protein ACKVY0_28835 [Prosthecobacter sp.]|uniref:hypothetical protein n=1 Tax=Prosthecobacter sp. TaxID=1965333 RepID=UPI003901096B
MSSCTHTTGHVVRNGYNLTTYGSDSYGGHGGGYGAGYAIWPMPTDNYAMYGTFDDPYEWGDSGYYRATKAVTTQSYQPAATARQQTSWK